MSSLRLRRSVRAFGITLALIALVFFGAGSGSTADAHLIAPQARAVALADGPTTPILDDFNRPNEDPLSQGGAWSPVDPRGGCCADVLSVVSNAAQNIRTVGGGAISYRLQGFPLDMELYATVAAKPVDGRSVALIFSLRQEGGASTWDGYYLDWAAKAGVDEFRIHRCENNSTCPIVAGPIQLEYSAGDKFMVRRIGTVIEGWTFQSGTWSKSLSTQDPGGWTGGKVGLHIGGGSGARVDDFGGGAFTPPSQVLDDFDRPDEDPLSQGGQWAPNDPRGGCCFDTLRVVSNQAAARNAANNISYRTSGFAGDVEVFATVATKPLDGNAVALVFNIQQEGSTGWDGYFLTWDARSGADTLRFEKIINNGLPQPDLAITNVEMSSGDKLMVRRIGNQMEGWVHQGGGWTLKLTATDATLVGGKIGALIRGTTTRLDDFGGGGPGGPPPPPPSPPEITTTSLPGGTVGVFYNELIGLTGGTAPYAWSLETGALPPGLALSSSFGDIQGTPTIPGDYSFTVKVTDDAGQSDSQPLSIAIAPPPPVNAADPPLLDDFDRSKEEVVFQDGNWSLVGLGGGRAAPLSGRRLRDFPVPGYSYRVRPYFGGKLQAAATISDPPKNEDWVSLFICLQDAGSAEWDGYELRATSLSNSEDRWQIWRIDDGRYTLITETFLEITRDGKMLLRQNNGRLEFWWRTKTGPWTRQLEDELDLYDSTYLYGMIGAGGLDSGSLDDFAGGSLLSLLDQYAPELRPSAIDTYRASSAAMLTDNISASGDANRLVVLGETRARPDWDPPRKLSLDYLRDFYPPDVEGGPQIGAETEDYLDAVDGSRLDDALRMYANPFYWNKTYARIVPESGDRTTLQYWLFYYYNWHPSTIGEHEGDWEMVQYELDALGVPTRAAYAHHGGGELCFWDFAEQSRTGRPVVYVARGSHASYFRSGFKEPVLTPDVPGGDFADGDAPPLVPSVIDIETAPPRWLDWPGFWGDRRGGKFSSPVGPKKQPGGKFGTPSDWANGANGCWEDFESVRRSNPDSSPTSTALGTPAPKVAATRVGRRVRISYSFAAWPDGRWRPTMLLTSVQSSGTRYAPYMKRHRISKRSGVVWQPLGLGRAPFKLFAAAYSRDGVSSALVRVRVAER